MFWLGGFRFSFFNIFELYLAVWFKLPTSSGIRFQIHQGVLIIKALVFSKWLVNGNCVNIKLFKLRPVISCQKCEFDKVSCNSLLFEPGKVLNPTPYVWGRVITPRNPFTRYNSKVACSVPDPGSGAILIPGYGIRNKFFSGFQILDPTSICESLVTIIWVIKKRGMLHTSTAPLPIRYTTMGYTSMIYNSTSPYFYKQFTVHKPLTKSFWNTLSKKYVNKYL